MNTKSALNAPRATAFHRRSAASSALSSAEADRPRPAIRVSGLTRRYGDFTAVDGIDFEVPAGGIFGLLGTNGAGKTSALEVIEGLAPASAGTVEVLGMDPVADRARLRPLIGIMMQEGGFPHELTVAESARMWHGTLSSPLDVTTALELVDLAARADRPIKALSGGERRRLDLALAVMGRPALLFLDEPTTGLDPESRRSAWNLLAALRDAGTTMVLTTHYMDEAQVLCDTMAIMHRGQIVEHGTIESIMAGHASTISFRAPAAAVDRRGADEVRLRELHGLSRGADLRALPSGAAESTGVQVRITTQEMQRDLHMILRWAQDSNLELQGLRAQDAELEQVFLSIAENA